MEKAKLTKEQAKAIEWLKSRNEGEYDCIVTAHTKSNEQNWHHEATPINGMPLDTLIRALYIGYEVEQTVEEQLLERYEAFQGCGFEHVLNRQIFRDGFNAVLDIIGMKVKGIND